MLWQITSKITDNFYNFPNGNERKRQNCGTPRESISTNLDEGDDISPGIFATRYQHHDMDEADFYPSRPTVDRDRDGELSSKAKRHLKVEN